MAEPNRLAAALSYEQDRPAFGNPSMLEQGRKMRERKQTEQVDRSAQKVKSDLLARALMYRYNPETLTGLTDTPGPQTLDEAAGLDPRVDRSTFLPYSQKEGLHVPAVAADLMKLATASNPQYSNLMQPEEAMPLATNMMGGGVVASRLAPAPAGLLGMNVWHGTPHRFPPTAKNPLGEFDASKIGTGEGAQAYGVGAGYLAEARGVADEYAGKLSQKTVSLRGMTPNKDQQAILDRFSAGANVTQYGEYRPWDALQNVIRYGSPSEKVAAKQLEKEAGFLGRNFEVKDSGSLYKVDLPDEHIAKMLDWDKPLSQQSAEVQKVFPHFSTPEAKALKLEGQNLTQQANDLFAAGKLDEAKAVMNRAVVAKARMLGAMGRDEMTGQSLHAQIQSMLREPAKELGPGAYDFGSKATSEMLRSLGIPGIRYLDQGSRSGGAGTSNFVVFDPAHMNIIGLMGGGMAASRLAPAPASSLGMNVVAKRAFTAPQDEVPQFVNTNNLPNQGRDLIRSTADELSTMLNQQGFRTDVKHSGSAAGPSSYVTVYDPQTGRSITDPARISGHSKGAFNSQFVHNISDDPQSMQKFVDLAMEMRAEGPSEMMKQQPVVEQALIEMRYKNAQKKIAKGKTLTKSEQEAVALKSAPDLLAKEK